MKKVLLVGAGLMAIDYMKVLKDINVEVAVVGRGAKSAENFFRETGIKVYRDSLDLYLKENKGSIDYAIVAVNVEELKNVTLNLLRNGVKNILLEKPGGINLDEIELIETERTANNADVFIAYNRRFYAAVLEAKKIITQDGGVKSFNFEFTEWSHVINTLDLPSIVKRSWFLGNSTHVVDMAFHMGGMPANVHTFIAGELNWHKPSIFAGAGISVDGALFNYNANWESPGRWAVEILTSNHRLIFKPLEKLQIQRKGSVEIVFAQVDYELDTKFKPGLYLQVSNFLNGITADFCRVDHQIEMYRNVYNKILGVEKL